MIETSDLLLRCCSCRSEKSFKITRAQQRQLAEGRRLQFYCGYCSSPQLWESVRPVKINDPLSDQPTRPKQILVVDDDELTLKLLRKVLEAWDARVEVAQNGKEALAKLAAAHYDLLVCDLRMPEMTGQELFQRIRDDGYLPPERILFLTGDKSPDVKQFLDGSGCYYLFKPLQFLDFSGQVQALLSGEPTG